DKNNTKLSFSQRKNMGYQILKAFEYIHSKKLLHRDISPNNILIKVYEELLILKVSDFGLVKNPDLQVTSLNTEFKGWFNDPALAI
ncbi:protein kinase family protein, partial [Enterococcus faecium]|nr:protein kinase family protein [Enterococcus faecium]